MRTRVTVVTCIASLLFGVVASSMTSCERASSDAHDEAFHRGREALVEGRCAEAETILEEYLAGAPRGRFASRAGLLLGKARIGQGRNDTARVAFESVIRDFPAALEAHKSRYKLALLAWLDGDTEDAIRRFRELAERPDGPLAAEAGAIAEHLSRRP